MNKDDATTQAIEAAEKHIKLGQSLQVKGYSIVKSIPTDAVSLKSIDIGALARLISQATQAIEKGVKIEQDANKILINLNL